MSPVDRRGFLAGAGAVAAAPIVGGRRMASGAAQATPFRWGVASFDPTPSGVLLWTRVDPAGGERVALDWVLARDDGLRDVVASGAIEVDATTDHCATVDATDLDDGGIWWFAFTAADGTRSPIGRTRTMTAGAVEHLRLAAVSCSRYASGGFAAYGALAEREVDVVVHLGDYIYEDGVAGVRAHEPAETLRTLDAYRARYAQHRTDADLQALHARHPMVAVWDDHELAGNAWRDGAPGHDPTRDGPWADRLAAASQAHAEWLPGRTHQTDDGRLQAWRALSLGETAQLVVLDTRAWGRDQQAAAAGELDGERSLLGEDQTAFVLDRLQRRAGGDGGPTRWTLLANQVMFHPLRVPTPSPAVAQAARDAGFLVAGDEAVNPDQWDGYPRAREQLIAALGAEGGVVVLTGDVHSSWAWEGAGGSTGEPAMVELVTPSVSAESLADRLPVPPTLVESALRGLSNELAYVELSSHGYLVVDLTADEVQGEWWYVDPDRAGSQRFGAARVAPRTAPMHLTEVAQPLPDPPPTTTSSSTTPQEPPQPQPTSTDAGDDGWSITAVGAVAAAAAVAGAIALRRRPRP